MSTPKTPAEVVGWREWTRLDELAPTSIKAKIDTGARTSSLHAFELVINEGEHGTVAHFELHPNQKSSADSVTVSLPVLEFREVRSSNGATEARPLVRTPIVVGAHRFDIDLTLTSRDEMGFRLLIGRTALRRRFLVDPARSFRQGEPQ